jgi:hypothetical protein
MKVSKLILTITITAVLSTLAMGQTPEATPAPTPPAVDTEALKTQIVATIAGNEKLTDEERKKLGDFIAQVAMFGRNEGYKQGQTDAQKAFATALLAYKLEPRREDEPTSVSTAKVGFWRRLGKGLAAYSQAYQASQSQFQPQQPVIVPPPSLPKRMPPSP